MGEPRSGNPTSLRRRILGLVGSLVLLSLVGSTLSLYRITEVNRLLDAINRVSIPLGRLFAQMQSDVDIFQRELERGLGFAHWKDPHWKARPIPRWIEDVLESESGRLNELVRSGRDWTTPEARVRWLEWGDGLSTGLAQIRADGAKLYTALEQHDEATANQLYPVWIAAVEEWRRQLQWGAAEYERSSRQTFSLAENRVADLRVGLEVILSMVVMLSLFFVWLGEKALRPLGELTRLAREITRRGLRREDKALLPQISLSRTDEVSQLAREFHHMATSLLEREMTVDAQKQRLTEQNRLLREMGELNGNVLRSIEGVLIVTDLAGKITQCNPVACRFLGLGPEQSERVIGTGLSSWPALEVFGLERFIGAGTACAIEPLRLPASSGRAQQIWGGHVMSLKSEPGGAIIVLDDLTDKMALEERLRTAENLAAVGRMSAQVAHEVRNPLHSIGLEAEVAAEQAARLGHVPLKQSLASILAAVDRLEKITANYLKLSRLSTGEKREADLGSILEAVLATYAPVCEAQGVEVDWRRESGSNLKIWADSDLLEQVFGNLFRNALQALETIPNESQRQPRVGFSLGSTESGRVWLRIEDNGPGVPSEIREKLFTPFVTTRAQGTGLGLSFIKNVLEDHGGLIRYIERPADSGLYGAGACFEVTLPGLEEYRSASPTAAPTSIQGPMAAEGRIYS